MFFSIIVAVFNREDTIGRALSSIKSQTFKDYQIILVDGASSDNTLRIANSFLTDNDILVSEPDSGIYDALNKGVLRSTGEVVCFLHSDDFYTTDYVLEEVFHAFSKNNFDIVYGDVRFFRPTLPEQIARYYKSSSLSKINLAFGLMPAHPSFFCKRRIYDKVGIFDTSYKIAADYDFLCRVSRLDSLSQFYINFPFVSMQIGGISTSGIKSKVLLNSEVLRALKNNGIYSNFLMISFKYFVKLKELFLK